MYNITIMHNDLAIKRFWKMGDKNSTMVVLHPHVACTKALVTVCLKKTFPTVMMQRTCGKSSATTLVGFKTTGEVPHSRIYGGDNLPVYCGEGKERPKE